MGGPHPAASTETPGPLGLRRSERSIAHAYRAPLRARLAAEVRGTMIVRRARARTVPPRRLRHANTGCAVEAESAIGTHVDGPLFLPCRAHDGPLRIGLRQLGVDKGQERIDARCHVAIGTAA